MAAKKTPTQKMVEFIEDRLYPGYSMSISRLCDRADIARSTWHDWKKGDAEPHVRTWRRIEDALPDKLCQQLRAAFA